jgi:hypothetical protein
MPVNHNNASPWFLIVVLTLVPPTRSYQVYQASRSQTAHRELHNANCSRPARLTIGNCDHLHIPDERLLLIGMSGRPFAPLTAELARRSP